MPPGAPSPPAPTRWPPPMGHGPEGAAPRTAPTRGAQIIGVVTGGEAVFVYLLEIGYLVYLRGYAWSPAPQNAPRRSTSTPFATWVATLLAVVAFGVTIGFAFPDAMKSFLGALFTLTVVFGGIAAGLVFTMTGPLRAGHGE